MIMMPARGWRWTTIWRMPKSSVWHITRVCGKVSHLQFAPDKSTYRRSCVFFRFFFHCFFFHCFGVIFFHQSRGRSSMRSLATKNSPIDQTTITQFSPLRIATAFHLCPGNFSFRPAQVIKAASSSTPIRRHIQCWSSVCWLPTGQLQPTDGPIWNSAVSTRRMEGWQSVTGLLIIFDHHSFWHRLSNFQDGHRCRAIRCAWGMVFIWFIQWPLLDFGSCLGFSVWNYPAGTWILQGENKGRRLRTSVQVWNRQQKRGCTTQKGANFGLQHPIKRIYVSNNYPVFSMYFPWCFPR